MPHWRRTLYTLLFTQFIAVTGFSFITPFIPYYVQELGITDIKAAGLWAGLVTSAQAVSMAFMAPVWGALSDRYGRKVMVMRATFAGSVVMTFRALQLVLTSRALLALFLSRILLRMGSGALGPVLPLFVQTLLPATARVATVTSVISGVSALGSAAGAPLVGRWGDRFGHRRLLLISSVAAALCFAPQALVRDPWALVFWQAASGFTVGGTISTLTALLARLSPEGHQGIVFGLDASAVSGANALGPMVGAVLAAGLGLRSPFLVAAGVIAIGTLAVTLGVHDERR